jgi:dUTP pyrophosphatase
MRLAIECHGRHHCAVVPPFTDDATELRCRQERDETKRQLCARHGVRYVAIPYDAVSRGKIYNLLHAVYIKKNSHITEFGVPYNRKAGDVGYDLHASHDMSIMPNQHVNIGTEVYLDMPYDIYASLLLRSSMAQKGLMTHQSLIDPGFRGELKLMVWNFSDKPVSIQKGERIAQVLFAHKAFVSLVPVDDLTPSERNTAGYGSTGSR